MIQENKAVYIPSIDAKDIFISNNYHSPTPSTPSSYNLRYKNGDFNLYKFINTLDYSLDLTKLREIYEKVYRRLDFSFVVNRKQYTQHVINVTFKYSNKAFNRIHNNEYIKFGYNASDLEFVDNVCVINGELIGIRVDTPTKTPISSDLLGKYFQIKEITANQYIYQAKDNMPTLNTRAELRKELYQNGFFCDGIHYIRFKRTSGSSRVGKCLFINEQLYKRMHLWEMCGLDINEGDITDLAALESYISLPTSSIIDTLEINAENILVIHDYESIFTDEVIATRINGKWLKSEQEKVEIHNSIWDGQSLIDESILGEYSHCGMVLLRNRFFKSCCFNTKIQQWFEDNNITKISQLKGYTLAQDIKDIKLITTPNSIKYLKFGSLEQWLNLLEPLFGIVKHDKPTHYFGGRLVQTHYQLINTLQLTASEVEEFLKPSLDFIKLLRTEPAVLRYYIKYPEDVELDYSPLISKNDIVFKLLGLNEKFTQTKLYQDFLNDLIKAYIKNLKCGHVLINGNYSVLLGNPVEMLQESIGHFSGKSQIGVGSVHSTRFTYNQTILGSRSPHCTMGNIWLPNNVENKTIDKYFNLTNEIVCINSINENTLQRLSGADFDSDSLLLTDNPILINAAKRNYERFKVPTSLVEAKKTKRTYTAQQKADLDIKTSVNKIGEIINLSQVLNSLYWDNITHGFSHEDNHELYCDIATLDVMSGIEIDKAKKEFLVDNEKELNKLKNKYKHKLTDEISGKDIKPHFFAHIAKLKGYYNSDTKAYLKHETSMDYLQTVINSYKFRTSFKKSYEPFSSILDEAKYKRTKVKFEQVDRVINLIRKLNEDRKSLWTSESLETATKHELLADLKQDCIDYIDKIQFCYSTMYWLLTLIEKPEYSDISKLVYTTLFGAPNVSFFDVIKESKEIVPIIEENNKGNIVIYGANYVKTYKKTSKL